MADKTPENIQNVKIEVDGKTCDVTANGLEQGVQISDLRDELSMEVLTPANDPANVEAAKIEEAAQDIAQSDAPENEGDMQMQLPSQDELVANAEEFDVDGDVAEIQPAAGEEIVPKQDPVEDEIAMSEIKKLSEIEPAAGNAGAAGGVSSASGYGFQSSFDAQGIISLDDVGPIDPTALEYGIEFRRDDNFIDDEAALPDLNPSLIVEDQQVYEDGSVTVFASASAELPTSTLTIVISGIPAGWDVTDVALDATDAVIGTGVFDAAAGTWTIDVPAGSDFNGGPVFSPPADSDIDALDIQFTVTETNAQTGQSGSDSASFDIVVDAVADEPDVDAANATGDEGDTLPIDISGLTGEEVNNGVGSDDGSESVVEYEVSGVPTGFTLSAGTETSAGSGVYILSEAELTGLTITPIDPNYSGSVTLTATIRTTENPVSDGEFDTSNNNAQNSEDFVLTWNPVADAPTLVVDSAQVKEDSSVFIPVEAELADTDGSEFLTITVDGIPSSWGLTGTGWVQVGPQTYEVTVPAGDDYADGFTLTPPADSDIDLTGITVTATSTETGNGDNASISENIDVIVDAVADAPSITASGDNGDEGEALNIDISGLTGEEVNNGAGSDDGSESVVEYEVSGVPTGFTLSAGTETSADSGVYILSEAELTGLTITPNDPNYSGSVTLTATIRTTENPVSDGEFDTSDNNAESSIDIDLSWAPVINPPSIKVNNGVDDALVKEDGTVDVPVVAQFGANASSSEYLTVTVTGIDASWGDFSAPIGTYSAATGTWTITLAAGEELNTIFTFTPAADSDIDLTGMVATVVATDPSVDPVLTADATDGFNVIVDAVVDAPSITASGDNGDEGEALNIDISGLTGEEVNNGAGSDDGSESVVEYEVSGVPTGFTLSAGTETSAGSGVYILSEAELTGLTITPNDPNYSGSVTLTATIRTTENPVSDGEFDTSDNNAESSIDIDLSWAPVINPPSIKVNNGVDDALVKEDGTVDVPVVAQFGANASSSEYLTVTVTGIDASWGDFSAPIGTYSAATGTWTITLAAGEELNTIFTFTPAADSDIDLTGMVATVVATDPSVDPVLTADATDGFNVIVDAVADAPNLNAGPDLTADEVTTIPLAITTSVNDLDGSEVIEVIKISGLPDGTSLTAGTYNATDSVWELDVADLNNLGLIVTDSAVDGNYTIRVESVAYEQNTNGTEVDLTDNRASAFDEIKITIDNNDIPTIGGDEVTVDETDLAPTTSASGNVNADFGTDGPGVVTANGSYDLGGLTSGGQPITVAYDNVANTYTGSAGGETIFVLTVNANGSFDFVLEGVVDHPNTADHDDSVAVEFGVTATDADGDDTNAVITVNIKDDGPYIQDKFKWVDETNLNNGPIGYTHTIPHDFGEDGPGEIEPTGNFYAAFQVGGPNQEITTGGVKVDVTATADGYVGTANGETIFTLTIDAQTGEYTYTQFKAIDHPDTTDHDDVIWLKFEVQIVDADGDTDTAIIGVDVHDDGPIAHDDAIKMNEDEGSVSGNVVVNDVMSQDFDNTVTKVSFGGSSADVPQNGDYVEILGANGKLLINMYGDYTYTPFDDVFDKTPGGSSSLDPVASDVNGVQESISKNGITVSVANSGDFDISWVNTADGSGLGIDNLSNGDSPKVWPKGETFDIAFDKVAQTVVLTIAELGSNNNNGEFGLDYVLYFNDGTSVTAEQQFVPSEIVDGHFTFTIDAADYGDKQIESLEINSTNDGQFYGGSFLLNNVEVTYPDECPECVEDDFVYTLTDADGDSDTATLHVEACPSEGVLIVGQNVDDTEDSVVPHLVNGDEGTITGGGGYDILVGDAGGSELIPQTQDYNFVFILDVSGSMGSGSDPNSRISLLKASVLNLLEDLGAYQDGEIMVHITPFATDVKTTATFNVSDANGLTDALAFIDALQALANGDGAGYTNYESPLVEANTWLQSDEPLDNAITTTYFISDGEPNRYLNSSDVVTSGSAGVVMNEITGSDGSDEVATLHSLNDDVIAVGINASSTLITRLSTIDSDGDAINIDDASDLSVVFEDTSPLDLLVKVGGDTIEGQDGNDIIFGDVLFTDDLADVYGINAEDGSGWEVFERLEAGESGIAPDWTRDDTIDYIRDNAVSLAEESVNSEGEGRQGGDDMILGGAGDDLIFGQEGDDLIYGGPGADQLYGGSGSDIFLYEAQDEGVDTIYDFTVGEDKLDLSLLLGGYDALTDDIAEFVIATENGGDTTISIDQSGNGGASGSFELVVLQGVTGLDLETAINGDTTSV